MKFSALILVSFLFIVACKQPAAPPTDDKNSQQEVIQFEKDVAKAFIAGDSLKLDRYFHNDYSGFYEKSPEDKATILKNVSPSPGVVINDLEMKTKVYSGSAVVRGVWEVKSPKQKPQYMRFVDMLVKEHDHWQIVSTYQFMAKIWEVRPLVDSDFVAATAPKPCSVEKSLKSINSTDRAFLRISNSTANDLTVNWINYEGVRDPLPDQIHVIHPGKYFDLYTYMTHPFVVTGANGKCYGIYSASTTPSMAVIKD